jgi:hypothetical protein
MQPGGPRSRYASKVAHLPPSRGGARRRWKASYGVPQHSHGPRRQPVPLSAGHPQVPDARPRGGVEPRQALARRRRRRRRPQARDLAPASRGQDRHGLPRLRPACRRAHQRRQRGHDAGGEALRSGARLPPGHLCHVVDSRCDSRIHPAQLVAREDGHHCGAEEAVLQPPPAQGPDRRRWRMATCSPRSSPRSRRRWPCPSRTW